MEVFNDDKIWIKNYTAITLGNFDGIHLGHQKLINTVKQYSKTNNLTSVVFSFYPHPCPVINQNSNFYTIFSPYEKKYLLEKIGIDILIQYPFTKEFANMEAEVFAHLLFEKLKCKVLVIGEEYKFGKNRTGTYEMLKFFGNKFEAEIIKVPSVNNENFKVSSTTIRKYIAERNIIDANELLDKPYFIIGEVISGNKLGRTIGFPTVNIIASKDKLLPPDGVYLTKTSFRGKIFKSITNIGKNPTVEGKTRTIETYIFDFNEDIYGVEICICFYDCIREEYKFKNVNELKKQIEADKKKAIQMFKFLKIGNNDINY